MTLYLVSKAEVRKLAANDEVVDDSFGSGFAIYGKGFLVSVLIMAMMSRRVAENTWDG